MNAEEARKASEEGEKKRFEELLQIILKGIEASAEKGMRKTQMFGPIYGDPVKNKLLPLLVKPLEEMGYTAVYEPRKSFAVGWTGVTFEACLTITW